MSIVRVLVKIKFRITLELHHSRIMGCVRFHKHILFSLVNHTFVNCDAVCYSAILTLLCHKSIIAFYLMFDDSY